MRVSIILLTGLSFSFTFFMLGCDGHQGFTPKYGFGIDIVHPPEAAPGTVPVTDPAAPPEQPAICDPFDGGAPSSANSGLVATLTYLNSPPTVDPDNFCANGVCDFVLSDFLPGKSNITQISNKIYLSQIAKPTSYFTQGFSDKNGNKLKDAAGNDLVEFFSLFMATQIGLNSSDPDGNYQFALFSDDGSIMKMQLSSGGDFETTVDNDGVHNPILRCSSPIAMNHDTKIPTEIGIFEGPRYGIAFTLFWRNGASLSEDEPFCTFGGLGNGLNLYDNIDTSPTPTDLYDQMTARGWKVVQPSNYFLPEGSTSNPCL